MERFNQRKLNKLEDRELYHSEVRNRFAALGNLNDE